MRRAPTLLDAAAQLSVVVVGLALAVEIYLGWDELIPVTIILPLLAALAMLVARGVRLLWWRLTGETGLVVRVHEHVDDTLGAGKYEARRAARIKRVMDAFTGQWKAVARPAHHPGAIQMTRIRRYVRLGFTGRRRPWWRRWGLWEIAAATLMWTSEAHVHTPAFFTRLEQKVAQALGLEWTDGLFDVSIDWANDQVTYTRKQIVKVPEKIAAREDLDD